MPDNHVLVSSLLSFASTMRNIREKVNHCFRSILKRCSDFGCGHSLEIELLSPPEYCKNFMLVQIWIDPNRICQESCQTVLNLEWKHYFVRDNNFCVQFQITCGMEEAAHLVGQVPTGVTPKSGPVTTSWTRPWCHPGQGNSSSNLSNSSNLTSTGEPPRPQTLWPPREGPRRVSPIRGPSFHKVLTDIRT